MAQLCQVLSIRETKEMKRITATLDNTGDSILETPFLGLRCLLSLFSPCLTPFLLFLTGGPSSAHPPKVEAPEFSSHPALLNTHLF